MNANQTRVDDLTDAMQTLKSLRDVIVKQRKRWHNMILCFADGRPSFTTPVTADYITKLYKDSEALEHMINRIENGLDWVKHDQRSRCTITSGEESE
jgi:hypothetical protein